MYLAANDDPGGTCPPSAQDTVPASLLGGVAFPSSVAFSNSAAISAPEGVVRALPLAKVGMSGSSRGGSKSRLPKAIVVARDEYCPEILSWGQNPETRSRLPQAWGLICRLLCPRPRCFSRENGSTAIWTETSRPPASQTFAQWIDRRAIYAPLFPRPTKSQEPSVNASWLHPPGCFVSRGGRRTGQRRAAVGRQHSTGLDARCVRRFDREGVAGSQE